MITIVIIQKSNKLETSQTLSESSATPTINISNINQVVSTDVDDDNSQGGGHAPTTVSIGGSPPPIKTITTAQLD